MFKSPMLAKDYEPAKLTFPKLGSVKLDGWRVVIHFTVLTTRSGKAVRNKCAQLMFGLPALSGLDGEMVVGVPNEQETFNRTDAALKKFEGDPDLHYYVFDCYDMPDKAYWLRLAEAHRRVEAFKLLHPDLADRVSVLEHRDIASLEELDEAEQEALDSGYEGYMLNDPHAEYKYGRSTVNEGYLLKVKRVADEEARIVGVEERYSNDNEAFKDELGRTKRSSHQENRTPLGMVGAFWVKSDKYEKQFKIGSGNMSHEEAKRLWEIREDLLNETVVFKYLVHGVKDVPRHGRFKAFRAKEDAATLA